MPDENTPEERRQRWTRRAERLRSERERIKKHGASIRRVYRDAVLKRKAIGQSRDSAGDTGPPGA
jgi:hypothetical protein